MTSRLLGIREAEAFRFVFEQVLKSCINEGLVGGEGFAVDASVVKADASRQQHHEDDDDWSGGSPAIAEYLEALQIDDSPTPTPPKKISQTDPAARWTAAPGGPAFYAYSINYLAGSEKSYRQNRGYNGDLNNEFFNRIGHL